MCSFLPLADVNIFGQSSHLYGVCFVCVYECRANDSLSLNTFPQSSHIFFIFGSFFPSCTTCM